VSAGNTLNNVETTFYTMYSDGGVHSVLPYVQEMLLRARTLYEEVSTTSDNE
jgi:hypothetical protein